jgi:hypothetical protein
MSRDIFKYAGIGLVMVLVVVAVIYISNRGSQIRLDGSIQQVRVQAMDARSCLVIIDFRFVNPANYPFIVQRATVILEDAEGTAYSGTLVAATEAKRVLEYYSKVNPELGPQYNEGLVMRDRVEAGESMDRMICARFEMPEAAAKARKLAKVRILDVDGATSELVEERESE